MIYWKKFKSVNQKTQIECYYFKLIEGDNLRHDKIHYTSPYFNTPLKCDEFLEKIMNAKVKK